MIRITELRLPISHPPEALEAAILERLNISASDLIQFKVFKRSYDARKNVALAFIYTVDLSVYGVPHAHLYTGQFTHYSSFSHPGSILL